MRAGRPLLGLCLVLGGCREAAAPATRVAVRLERGPAAGSYESSASRPACVLAPAGPGGVTVQYTDWTGPKHGLRSLSLVVPSPARPTDFYLGMVFGDFFAGQVLEIDTRATTPVPRGHGQVAVQSSSRMTTVTVTGETDSAVPLTATITCLNLNGMEGTDS